jgi:radical SAM protein with 4Fe4S-binding SPASM domain
VQNHEDSIERRVLTVLQDGLPVSRTPYADTARRAGVSTDDLLAVLREWRQTGTMRRIGAVLNHLQVGLAAGAMVVWKVEPTRVAQVGAVFAEFGEVSHAYERRTAPGWEYNLYTMMHGPTDEAVRETVQRMSRAAGVTEYLVLATRRELKKTAPRYVFRDPCLVVRAPGHGSLVTGRVLRILFWESTVRCNLTCAHCRRLESNEAGIADLSTSSAESLIEQVAELGRRQPQMPVMVFSGGEPLCREDLFHLIGCARQRGIIPALATNGTLIDAAMARRIADSGIARVSVSLDGATADVHDEMRRIPGAFDAAIQGIGHLRSQGVPFQINVTLTKHNAHQLHHVYEVARSLGAVALHIFMLVPVGCGETLAQTDMLSPQEYEHIMRDTCALEAAGQIQIKVTCGPHYERIKRELQTERGDTNQRSQIINHKSKGCLAGLGVLFVSHRGDVYPCGYLPVNCGNVLETPLVRIWDESGDLARMRDADALEGKCGLCGYKRVCGGCRARAFAATGNYMAQEPFCVYVPPNANTGGTGQ